MDAFFLINIFILPYTEPLNLLPLAYSMTKQSKQKDNDQKEKGRQVQYPPQS